jgi:hypothetical protein
VLLSLVVMCFASAGFAQEPSAPLPRFELFGGYSVNADFVQDRPVLVIVDQKVSPFFSHGSGPTGGEVSFKYYVRRGIGIKSDVSSYFDAFPPGSATYCQPAGCGAGLTFEATGRARQPDVAHRVRFHGRGHQRNQARPGTIVPAGKVVRSIAGETRDIRLIWASGFDTLPEDYQHSPPRALAWL